MSDLQHVKIWKLDFYVLLLYILNIDKHDEESQQIMLSVYSVSMYLVRGIKYKNALL